MLFCMVEDNNLATVIHVPRNTSLFPVWVSRPSHPTHRLSNSDTSWRLRKWLLEVLPLIRMGVSIEEYRQRIGCFAGVATILSSYRVRSNNSNTCRKQGKHSRIALTVFIRWVHWIMVGRLLQNSTMCICIQQCIFIQLQPWTFTFKNASYLFNFNYEHSHSHSGPARPRG